LTAQVRPTDWFRDWSLDPTRDRVRWSNP